MLTTSKKTSIKNHKIVSALFLLLVLSTGCANSNEFPLLSTTNPNETAEVDHPGTDDTNYTQDNDDENALVTLPSNPTTTGPIDQTPSSESPVLGYKMEALAWETEKNPERKLWSQYLEKIILEDWNSLLPGSDDITDFCPRYNSLDNNERANVWAQLFVAMAKFESAYNPLSRMHETTMGTDAITGKPVYSEGLLQLSYQDIQWDPWCKFDWSKDKNLSPTDPKKTILSPYLNLDCGVGIMAKQIKNKGRIVVSSGVYWSVLKAGGRYQKISSIQSIVKSLLLCK